MTKCACCNNEFVAHEEGAASGCAATVVGGELRGDFGSVIADMTSFEIIGLDLEDGDTVCDNCIHQHVVSGRLVQTYSVAAVSTNTVLQQLVMQSLTHA